MLGAIPLLVIPFILYNLGLASPTGNEIWERELFSLPMMSGGVWTMTWADGLVAIALVLLFVEIMKSTQTSNRSIIDHVLSLFVFVAFLVEFLLVQGAAYSLFFTLMLTALVDVLAGFSVTIRSSGRDVNF
ncbi:MAG TPA: hypothetical protein VIU14_16835 [Mesorhizobium sp.]|jgi:hypothetical protein